MVFCSGIFKALLVLTDLGCLRYSQLFTDCFTGDDYIENSDVDVKEYLIKDKGERCA